jgi:hypothetical protein
MTAASYFFHSPRDWKMAMPPQIDLLQGTVDVVLARTLSS